MYSRVIKAIEMLNYYVDVGSLDVRFKCGTYVD